MWDDLISLDYSDAGSDWSSMDFGFDDAFSGWGNEPMMGLGAGGYDFGNFSGDGGLDMQSFSQLPFNPSLMSVPGMQPQPALPGLGGGPMPGYDAAGAAGSPLGGAAGGAGALGAPGAMGPVPQQPPGAMNIAAPQGGGMTGNPTMDALLKQIMSPQGMLGLGGGLAGILGTIAGGGKGASVTPKMPMEMRNAGTQTQTALSQLNPFVTGTNPLMQQQSALLGALASGQGLPPGYAQLVEQAFQPQMGNIAHQAIESARRRGFAGGAELLGQGPAGAIAGPMLADLQGQMAQAKLGLMQSLPGLYNTPIQNQMGAASNQVSGFNNLMRSYPTGQQQSAGPLASQIGTQIGAGLQGISQTIGQQEQQKTMQELFRTMQGGALGQPKQNVSGGLGYAPTEPR